MRYFLEQLDCALSLIEYDTESVGRRGQRASVLSTKEGLKKALQELQQAKDNVEKTRGLPDHHRSRQQALRELQYWLRMVRRSKDHIGRHGASKDTQYAQ